MKNMFKRSWLFWEVRQCELVVNVTSYKSGYIICIAVEACNHKNIFKFRKQRRMYRCIRKIVDLHSIKKFPCFVDCLEVWELRTAGTIRVCPGTFRDCCTFQYLARTSHISLQLAHLITCIRRYFFALIFCKCYE